MGWRSKHYGLNRLSKRLLAVDSSGTLLTNIVTNGNMVNTTGWSATAATLAVLNNELIVTANGTQAYGMVTYETSVNSANGKKAYLGCKISVNNGNAIYMMAIIDAKSAGTNQEITIASPLQDAITQIQVVKTQPSDVNGVIVLKFIQNYSNAGVAANKVMKISKVILLDLTTDCGAGNEPSQDAVINALASFQDSWFEGTQKFYF